MNKALNILVTGCGGDIGQSLGKILLKSAYTANLFGIYSERQWFVILFLLKGSISRQLCNILQKEAGRVINNNFN